MKKYADGEGKLEVLRGHEAEALTRFESKVGKTFAQLDDDERKELHKVLEVARKQNKADEADAERFADESASDNKSE